MLRACSVHNSIALFFLGKVDESENENRHGGEIATKGPIPGCPPKHSFASNHSPRNCHRQTDFPPL